MNARRAARELTLMALSQLSEKDCQSKNIDSILLSTIRTLVNDGEEELKTTASELVKIREFVEKHEMEHPTNLERPIDTANVPVQIPMTSDMLGRIDSVINTVETSFRALEIAEIAGLSNKEEVKDFVKKLIKSYCENKKHVDEMISKHSIGWNIDRLVKIDKTILRIAASELLYTEDVPVKVTIDEAVELAKKYSTEESSSFVNGILGQISTKEELPKKAK